MQTQTASLFVSASQCPTLAASLEHREIVHVETPRPIILLIGKPTLRHLNVAPVDTRICG
jgi:hypothetical protein